jgi:CPA1 family monovalent cation:H+ antiporter
MRGLVTLATALALPQEFPGHDLILLSALAVVLGTLIVQGITLGPLIRMLRFAADSSLVKELASARVVLLDLAIEGLRQRDDEPARSLRDRYLTERSEAAGGGPRTATAADDLHRQCIDTQRRKLFELWTAAEIDDDVFHSLELELDLQELASSPTDRFELIEE